MSLGTAASVLLGLILLSSGVLKASDAGWPDAGRSFGVPAWALRLVVPAELVLGSLLVVDLGSPFVAWAAVGLLVGFSAVVAVRLGADADGAAPMCACFGGLSRSPISWRTLVRNGVFIGVGVVSALG